jgi:lanosterol synthase
MAYEPPRTDPLGWRLVIGEDSHGQQKWKYLSPGPARDEWKQDKVTKYALGLEVGARKLPKAKTPGEAARNGFEFYKLLQSSDGHFATEYGGMLSLTSIAGGSVTA